jgi:hypothetical protein
MAGYGALLSRDFRPLNRGVAEGQPGWLDIEGI